ncbi:ABC transporter permease [Kiloniella laminariae]|uniref:ABC transporter permease n=1 Tax=Kiloniella laminariae TaxID=454162 RepID=A0ABT4LJ65_9PROT|nr:ABC transporter permease [Kiloniella laminariae]MCZ4281153.1 ABC transporter permease [Kiloniella laminariae]
MLGYIINRLLAMIPTLLVISVIIFTLIQLPPGDFLETQIAEMQAQGENVDQAKIEYLRQEYGLDKPVYLQYLSWVTGLLQGDLGYSFEHELPVTEVIGDRITLTIILAFAATLFTYVMSFPIGIYTAVKQYSLGDYVFSFVGFIGLATPNFLLALILLYFANVWFGTSIGGLMDPQYIGQPWSLDKLLSVLEHLWVPVVVIGTSGTAGMIRRLRANMLDELQKQYVITAKAKGLSPLKILIKYPLRLAINPFIADIGSILPDLLSGSVLVAVVMGLETTGPMLVNALLSQDMYLAGSFLIIESSLVVLGVFLSDLILAAIDPRIRLGGGAVK